ncbi:MAG: hypothetical protein H3C55_08435 [Pseudorhodoplanes sp.]|nr:hypothetical protein [Pseudorhodoplanes sp.]MBW7949363.1 hypothetical protein [Pseudorhodoplanes sp.]GIK81592.1 MAG: hypothetical protein BroJett024_26970 [Alphaproteobacteria bacterium]
MGITIITGIIGIALLFAFVGFMLIWVKALPLIIIAVITGAMVVYDFVQTVRAGESGV